MPKHAHNPALDSGILPPGPPLPPRIASRLGLYLVHPDTRIRMVLTERAKAENGHPRIKLPQFTFPGIERETGTDTITGTAAHLAESAALAILSKQPYSLPPAAVGIHVHRQVLRLALPWHVQEAIAADEMHYIWVMAMPHAPAPHLENLDLHFFHTQRALEERCQSYREALYRQVGKAFHGVLPLSTRH